MPVIIDATMYDPVEVISCYPPADNTYACLISSSPWIAATTPECKTPLLDTLGLVIIIDAALRTVGVDTPSLWKLIVHSAVDILLKDRVGLDMLELGLEVLQAGSVAAAVRSATGIGQVEAFILDFFTIDTPATTRLALSSRS